MYDEIKNLQYKKNKSEDPQDFIMRNKIKICAKNDIFKHAIPKEYGGSSTTFNELCNTYEQLGYRTLDTSLILSISAHVFGGIFPIYYFGSEKQKKCFLSPIINSDLIAGHAITEPDFGSSVTEIKTTAQIINNEVILNGEKIYITNAPIADVIILYAKVEEKITAFIIKKDDFGVNFTSNNAVNCFHSSPIGKVILKNCKLPKSRILGSIGGGAMIIQKALELERAFLFSGILGIMKWQLEQIIQYSDTRLINNSPLRELKNISHKIAEMSLRLETCKLWISKCATLKTHKKRITVESAYTKIYISEAFLKSCMDSVQILGAYGLEKDQIFTQLVLDALGSKILSGTNEIQKNIINYLLYQKSNPL